MTCVAMNFCNSVYSKCNNLQTSKLVVVTTFLIRRCGLTQVEESTESI